MKKVLTFLIFTILLGSCISFKPQDKVSERSTKFEFFRIASHYKRQAMIDYDGVIWIYKDRLVIKGANFEAPDKAFIFDRKINMRKSKAWDAHPYGEPNKQVYIEYKKGEYITILYIKMGSAAYFISKELKNTIEPLPSKGVWYEKLN